ncbi:DNA-directed RNA polymerase II subunit GRINL1A [Acrasis kona]|uniref:DNA-directed RNA polymerase II subunit GRINL1A n=1 Tax=Acrasis kona TaxID=1008807 RepID=A0AAW2YMK3_9EUKA
MSPNTLTFPSTTDLTNSIVRLLEGNIALDAAIELERQITNAYQFGDALIPLLATLINKLSEQERATLNLTSENESLRQSICYVRKSSEKIPSTPSTPSSPIHRISPKNRINVDELYTLQTTKILDTNKFQNSTNASPNKRCSYDSTTRSKASFVSTDNNEELDVLKTLPLPQLKKFQSPSCLSSPTTPKKRFLYKPDECELIPTTLNGCLSSPTSPKKVHFDVNDHYNEVYMMTS